MTREHTAMRLEAETGGLPLMPKGFWRDEMGYLVSLLHWSSASLLALPAAVSKIFCSKYLTCL